MNTPANAPRTHAHITLILRLNPLHQPPEQWNWAELLDVASEDILSTSVTNYTYVEDTS